MSGGRLHADLPGHGHRNRQTHPPERAAAPHELFDLVDPDGPAFTVADWLEAAETQIAATRESGRWPIVGWDQPVRAELALRHGCPRARPIPTPGPHWTPCPTRIYSSKLEQEAPEDADRIHANDRRRTIRALERAAAGNSAPPPRWDGPPRDDFVAIGLDWPVESINRRINARVKAMAADGLIDEVRALHDANRMGRQAQEALGYREIVDHLEGRCSAEDAFERIKIGTRRFAKQQRTWLRRFGILPGPFGSGGESSPPGLASEQEEHIFFHLRWILIINRIEVDSGTASRHRVSLSPLIPPCSGSPLAKKKTSSKASGGNNAANLVIVESPAKAKTIQKYLRPLEPNLGTFDVQASVGHVRDLPSKSRKGMKEAVPGVDLEKTISSRATR